MALTPAGFDPVKPQALHPRLAELWFIRCQTSLNSLIYGANFRNYVRVTEENSRRLAHQCSAVYNNSLTRNKVAFA